MIHGPQTTRVPIYRDSQEGTRRAASSLGHSTIFGSEHRKPSTVPILPTRREDRRGPGEEIHRLSDFANLLDSGPESSPGQAFRRNDRKKARLGMTSWVGAGKPEPPNPLFVSAQPQGVKPLMTHCFLQVLVNPHVGIGPIELRVSQCVFTVVTFEPRLVRVKLWRFGAPYTPVHL